MAKYTKLALTVNLVLFLIIFVVHALRLIFTVDVKFGGWLVPLWFSGIALVLALIVIYLNYKSL